MIDSVPDEIVLLCKGAETAVLKIGISGEIDKTNQHIHDYAVVSVKSVTTILFLTQLCFTQIIKLIVYPKLKDFIY